MAMIHRPERYPAKPSPRPHVIVVGGGVAGMSAAHRLLERGHDVTLLERDSFLGGNLGAHREGDELPSLKLRDDAAADIFGRRDCANCTEHGGPEPCRKALRAQDWHEHCYHMYLNWYHNFWSLMRDVGVIDRFVPKTEINYLRDDSAAPAICALNPGAPSTLLQNMTCGVATPADTFLHAQAMLDLLGLPRHADRRLDQMSVAAFLREHSYTTEASRRASHRVLAKAFAAPSAIASASTYKSFVKYGARLPEPTMWLLDGNTEEAIFLPWLKKLASLAGRFEILWGPATYVGEEPRPSFRKALDHFESLGRTEAAARDMPSFTLRALNALTGLEIDPETGEFLMRIEGLDVSPSTQPTVAAVDEAESGRNAWTLRFDGPLVLAIPARQLGKLVYSRADKTKPAELGATLAGADPHLANAARLQGAPIIQIDLYFRRQLDRPVPPGIVILLDSKYEMSLYDNAQMWRSETPDEPSPPMISVCASDADELMPFAGQPGGAQLIVDQLIAELRRYVRFDPETDIMHCRTHLQTNAGEELFVNSVNSWHHRPRTATAIPNLFIAGDYVQTPIDVVTIEAAAMSGLMAAEGVRRRTGLGPPVEIVTPDSWPNPLMAAAGAMSRPVAYWAKAVSEGQETLGTAYSELFPES